MRSTTGHHNLRSSEIIWNSDCVSSQCNRGVQEFFEHFSFQCEQYTVPRFNLLNLINYIDHHRYSRLPEVLLVKLFGQDPALTQKDNKTLISAFISFIKIKQTGRFK